MCAASLFLTAIRFKHYKDSDNIYKYKYFAEKFFFFLCFFFGCGFYLCIYTRVNAGGWWRSSGAGCSSANWRRIVAGVPRGGRSSSSRGGQLARWWRIVAPFLGAWPTGGPRGWLHVCRVSQVDTVCKCAGVGVCKCAEPRTCVSVQMCSHLQGMCANVQADVCKCAGIRGHLLTSTCANQLIS